MYGKIFEAKLCINYFLVIIRLGTLLNDEKFWSNNLEKYNISVDEKSYNEIMEQNLTAASFVQVHI